MFSEKDIAQIERHGLTAEKVEGQLNDFRSGFGYLPVTEAATVGNGILSVDEKGVDYFVSEYSKASAGLDTVKFVPASGAATRMFKELFSYVSSGQSTPAIQKLLANTGKFAFAEYIDTSGDGKSAIQSILDYGAQLPKALILFHKYPDYNRTAMDEHLAEGAIYANSGKGVKIHFTISPEHREGFEERLGQMQAYMEKKFGVKYNVSFSQQKSSTDTIAVTPENEPFREEDGSLLFRPAGHGALIENLNAIEADIVFIKNIDNVTPDHLKNDTVTYKKVIGGVLLSLREKVFNYLNMLERGTDESVLAKTADFVRQELCCRLPENFPVLGIAEKTAFLRKILDRPIRVCGMVKNEGEPGGGPFWSSNSDGTVSLQIAEPSQISPEQAHLLKEGTHFNPVDLVCSVRDRHGNKYDLSRFTDPATGFISEKSKNGKPLKALELPGLWNGAMSDWNTVFVEVPVSTFTPVKEVTDLLRPQHQ